MSHWYPGTAALLTAGCRAAELEQRLTVILASLPPEPTQKEFDTATVALNDIYHRYQDSNACASNGLVPGHRCITDIYKTACEKLFQLHVSTTLEARALRKERKNSGKDDDLPAAPSKPDKFIILGKIRGETDEDTSPV